MHYEQSLFACLMINQIMWWALFPTGIRSSGGAKSSSSGALADNGPTPVLSDSADWLKEYLDGARKQVDERYRANPKSEVRHSLYSSHHILFFSNGFDLVWAVF